MKILLVILFSSLALLAPAQNVDKQAEKIRVAVELTNASKLDIKSYRYSNKCGVLSGTLKIHSKNGEIKKISDTGIGDDDKAAASWNYQYYYQNGALIFSHQTKRYFDNEKNKEASEDIREYFAGNRLIKQIENLKTTSPKNIRINQKDIRYQLKFVKNKSDLDQLYKCL